MSVEYFFVRLPAAPVSLVTFIHKALRFTSYTFHLIFRYLEFKRHTFLLSFDLTEGDSIDVYCELLATSLLVAD